MGYRIIKTTTLWGSKRIQWKSTGHNGGHEKRERKKHAASDRFKKIPRRRHLPRAGS